MKLSKLTLACLLATSGLSATSATQAAVTDGLEFHGSFRSGVLLSKENDYKRNGYAGAKTKLGRLGMEADNDMNFGLIKKWDFDNGKSIRVKVAVAGTGDDKSYGSSVDADSTTNSMGFGETYVALGGITESGTLWAGKRDYGKDNYIFMTDFFYTNMSGLGIGVSDYEIGDLKFDLAYMTSDRAGDPKGRVNPDAPADAEIDANTNKNNIMHSVHIGANFGSFELHGQIKAMPDNWGSESWAENTTIEFAESGFDLTAIYNMSSFLYLPGNGFSKVIVQAGQGLGSHNLLGGTLNGYNGYQAGNWGGPDRMTHVFKDDRSARFFVWGGYFLDSGINFFPSLQAAYNDNEDGSSDYWMSAMVRPTFPVADGFYIATEVGMEYNTAESVTGENKFGNSQKVSIAPTWVLGTGQGPAPEIRLLASYVDSTMNYNSDVTIDKDDILVGLQADVWW